MNFNSKFPTPLQETEFRIAKHLRKTLHLDCESKMEWISVEKSFPENNEYTLCWDGKDIYLLKFHQTSDKRHKKMYGMWDSSSGEEYFDDIKYWMPLPQPPQVP